jgi:hypothetical protein
MMRRFRFLLLLASIGLAAGPSHVHAQNIAKGLAGGALGVAGGGYVTLSLVVAQARAGHYVQGMDDFLGWRSAPVLIGGATGLAVGLWYPDRLLNGVIGGTVGTAAGLGAGILIGPLLWDDPEANWAGGAIGAGIGMVTGSVIGVLLKPSGKGGDSNSVVVPLAFRVRI